MIRFAMIMILITTTLNVNAAISFPRYEAPDIINNPQSLTEIKRLAKYDDPRAQFQLAQLYEIGVTTKEPTAQILFAKNIDKSIELYTAAAEKADMKAEYQLGLLYLQGTENLERNLTKAYYWLEKSAFQGNPYAEYALGLIFEHGIIDDETGDEIKQNLDIAAKIYSIAASSDMPEAKARLKTLKPR